LKEIRLNLSNMNWRVSISMTWNSVSIKRHTTFAIREYGTPPRVAPPKNSPIWGIRMTKNIYSQPTISVQVQSSSPTNYIYPMLKEQVRVTPVDANTLQIPAAGSCSKCEGVKMKYNHNSYVGHFDANMQNGKVDFTKFCFGCLNLSRHGHDNPFRLQIQFITPTSPLFGKCFLTKPIVVSAKCLLSVNIRHDIVESVNEEYSIRVEIGETNPTPSETMVKPTKTKKKDSKKRKIEPTEEDLPPKKSKIPDVEEIQAFIDLVDDDIISLAESDASPQSDFSPLQLLVPLAQNHSAISVLTRAGSAAIEVSRPVLEDLVSFPTTPSTPEDATPSPFEIFHFQEEPSSSEDSSPFDSFDVLEGSSPLQSTEEEVANVLDTDLLCNSQFEQYLHELTDQYVAGLLQ